MTKKSSQSHKKNWGAQVQHGVARKKDLGNTNTPLDLARAIVDEFLTGELERQAHDPGRWLEPAVGTGNFYLSVLAAAKEQGIDPWKMAQAFDAIDIDAQAIAVLKKRLQEAYGWAPAQIDTLPIACTSLAQWSQAASYRVIVTNPPYLAPKDWSSDPEVRRQMLEDWQALVPGLDPRSDLFLYFFRWCHAHLEPGGVSLFLCSDGWLDSEYGKVLRNDFLGDRLTLEILQAWPWASLFRDDTCPVVTVVRHTQQPEHKGPTRLVVHDGSPLKEDGQPIYRAAPGAPVVQQQTLSPSQLAQWLGEGVANRRARIVAGPELHDRLERALASLLPALAPFGEMAHVTGFGWSLNDIERAGLLLAQPGATGKKGHDLMPAPDPQEWEKALPLFFQKQARVGKPVDYSQARSQDMLGCRVRLGTDKLSERIRKGGERLGGAWVSLAIDRFPLVFFQAQPLERTWVGVSKYAHASLIQDESSPAPAVGKGEEGALLCALLNSTLAILAMERYLKEGTRKTLRVNENGYAKEITRALLKALPVPDWRKWGQGEVAAVLALQAQRAVKNIHRLDVAVQDPDWVAVDDAIGSACGIGQVQMQALRDLALTLYWRRMRNVIEYGPAFGRVLAPGKTCDSWP